MADKIKKDPLFEAINNMKVGQDPAKKKKLSPISKYKRMNPWSRESFLAEYPDLSPIERERKRREEEKQKAPWKENIREMTALDREALGWHAPIYWRPGEGSPIDEGIPRNILTLDDEGELAYLLHPKKWSESLQRMVFDYDQDPIGILKIPKDKPPSGFEPMLGPDGVIEYVEQDRSDRQYIEPLTGERNIFSSFEWYDAELQTHIDKHGWPSNYPPLTGKQKDRLANVRGRRHGMPSEPYHEFTNMPEGMTLEEARKRGGEGVGWIPYEPPEQPYYPPTDWETYQAEQPWAGSMSSPSGYHRIRSDSVRHQDRAKYEEWKEKRREAEVGMQERMVDNPWFDRYLED